MTIAPEISELDGGKTEGHRALKYAASLLRTLRTATTPLPKAGPPLAEVGGIKAMPCAWERP